MTITREDFVAAFPEFGDVTRFPQAQFDFWAGEAIKQISVARYGASYDLASMLFVAHNLALSAAAARGGTGGSVGGSTGLVASKSVDKVSVSYDTSTTAYAGAGIWNATPYGQRLFQLMRAFGIGPYYSVKAHHGYSGWPYPR